MKIYFAGGENRNFFELLIKQNVKNILLSYYYLSQNDVKNLKRFYGKYWEKDLNIFLDCGAFTAWSQGVKINLNQYINFIKANKDYITVYASLDDKNNPNKTKTNLLEMEKEGLKPLPVYHVTMKDYGYFEELCKKYSYVAVGAIAGGMKDYGLVLQILRKLTGIAEKYKTKLHIFGLVSYEVLGKVPIYSCDATTWLMGGKQGTIIIPDHARRRLKEYYYKNKELFKHKDYIERCGVKYEEIIKSSNWKQRDIVNIKTFLEVERNLTKIYEYHKMRYWEEEIPEEFKNYSETFQSKEFKERKGKIQEIVKNPSIEEKRLRKMYGNLFHFTTGKTAKSLPLYCNDCYAKDKCPYYVAPKENEKIICAIQPSFYKWFPKDFDIRDEEKINDLKEKLMKLMLDRLAKQLWFESLDGGIQDKATTNLAFGIIDRLKEKQPIFNLFDQRTKIDSIEIDIFGENKKLEKPEEKNLELEKKEEIKGGGNPTTQKKLENKENTRLNEGLNKDAPLETMRQIS